jgi:hypothetical protein
MLFVEKNGIGECVKNFAGNEKACDKLHDLSKRA